MIKSMKSIIAPLLSLSLGLSILAGCSGAPEPQAEAELSEASVAQSAPPEEEEAPDVSKVLLVVSFGTSYDDSREVTIGAIENKLRDAYPDYEVRRAFTSQIIIGILAERGIETDNVTQAMDRLVADGVKEVVLQPTHVMSGFEYDDVISEVAPYQEKFDSFKIGEPLLTSDADYDRVIAELAKETAKYSAEGTVAVFMGHGTEHEANAAYAKLQERIAAGHGNIFIGTVEAEPALEEVMALVKASGATKVVLLPLMVVAGDHASNDMAGDDEDSWKSAFAAAGYEVECVLKGLGQYAGIQDIYAGHVADAIAK